MKFLSGETKIVPIVGYPVGQVKSPSRLSQKFIDIGQNTIVIPAEVHPDNFSVYLAGIDATANIHGLIATVPHKQALIDFCTVVSERARYAGSANIMVRSDQGWRGDNTDGLGHCYGILHAGGVIQNARVLLIGAGGAGAAIAYEFLQMGCLELAIHDVDETRRDQLIARLSERFSGRVTIGGIDPSGFDIISNATPLGMREGDPLPIDVERLQPSQFVGDVVTKPAITALIRYALDRGCPVMRGEDMFEAQGDLLIDVLSGRPIAAAVDAESAKESR